ncbi:MAG: CXXX repeat peptide maturase [Muribaculaceae bacterium]|nr:CXXX repeat peptide maturase [Muribaculaceae bacterium]
MLKYLVILLDDSAVSYCHYESGKERKLISLEALKSAILFAMKENLNVHIVWPDYELPKDYKEIINGIDHINFADASFAHDADILVANPLDWDNIPEKSVVVVKTGIRDFIEKPEVFLPLLKRVARLNILFEDISVFKDEMVTGFSYALDFLTDAIIEQYKKQNKVQVNILTDRLILDQMNNCNAGDESVTLAPDGQFYVCPAFYFGGEKSVGNPNEGVHIKNSQLFRLDHAPICRNCDAYQCNRCVWLNKQQTLEVNTPGHEQCVICHLERNASKRMLDKIREIGEFLPGKEIPDIDYLDPFEKIEK